MLAMPELTPQTVDLHQLHRAHLQQLDYVLDQIQLFREALSMVISRHPDDLSLLEHVEEYRAILHRKQERALALKAAVQAQEHQLALQASGVVAEPCQEVLPDIQGFGQEFELLRQTLRRFISRHD